MHGLCRQHHSYHIQCTVRCNGLNYLQVLVGKTTVNEINEMKVKEQICSCTGHRCGAMVSGAMWLCGPGAVLDWSWPITASSSRPPGVGHHWALHLACPHIASLRKGQKRVGRQWRGEHGWETKEETPEWELEVMVAHHGARAVCYWLKPVSSMYWSCLSWQELTSLGAHAKGEGKQSVRGLEQQRETGRHRTYLVPLWGKTWWGACQGVEESDMKKWCWGVVWVFVFIAHYHICLNRQ